VVVDGDHAMLRSYSIVEAWGDVWSGLVGSTARGKSWTGEALGLELSSRTGRRGRNQAHDRRGNRWTLKVSRDKVG
jgi:hypothetical protein